MEWIDIDCNSIFGFVRIAGNIQIHIQTVLRSVYLANVDVSIHNQCVYKLLSGVVVGKKPIQNEMLHSFVVFGWLCARGSYYGKQFSSKYPEIIRIS